MNHVPLRHVLRPNFATSLQSAEQSTKDVLGHQFRVELNFSKYFDGILVPLAGDSKQLALSGTFLQGKHGCQGRMRIKRRTPQPWLGMRSARQSPTNAVERSGGR